MNDEIRAMFDEQTEILSKAFTRVELRIEGLETRMDERFAAVDQRFDAIDQRLNRIENIVLAAHDRRIEQLEDSVRTLKTKLGVA